MDTFTRFQQGSVKGTNFVEDSGVVTLDGVVQDDRVAGHRGDLARA